MHHARVIVNFLSTRRKCCVDQINLGGVNCELGLHADRLEEFQLSLQTLLVLVEDVGSVDGNNTESMAVQSEPLTSEVKLFVVVASVDFEVSSEVIRTKGGSNEAVLSCFKNVFDVRQRLR